MARMYSRKKGKHGSKRPIKKAIPGWVRYDAKETEALNVKLAKTGKTTSEIGLILRDSYGVPSVKNITGNKITKILEKNNLKPKLPEDIVALINKDILIMKHLEANKHDMAVRRGQIITESKIDKLAKYYKRTGKLSKDWIFDRTKAKTFIS